MARMLWRGLAAVGAVIFFSSPLLARPALADDDFAGPGVARVSLIAGDVGIGRGDTDTTVAATINAPLLAGDYLTTGDDGGAEIQIDSRSMIRAAQNVQLRLINLEPQHREAQVALGTVELRTFAGYEGQPQIDTPSIGLRAAGDAATRITVDQDGGTQVTVRAGRVEILTPDRSFILTPGTTLVAHGDVAAPSIDYTAPSVYAVFDTFCDNRDADVRPALTLAYVPPALAYSDFATYGRFVADPRYGRVWVPAGVASDWAPYRYGRWVWEDGYGWVWLSDEPWGWAPYHYGRWFYSANYGWCWVPPPVAVRPIWSPALVGFFTFGGVAVGIGYGNIAWVPLGPFEAYHPWYYWNGKGFHPVTAVNVTVVQNNITRIYGNINRPGAITGVSGQRFLEGRFDHPRPIAVTALRNVSAVHGALPVVPTERNLTFSNRAVSPQLRASDVTFRRPSFAGTPSIAVPRTPFTAQRSMMTTHVAPTNVLPTIKRVDPWSRFNRNVTTQGGGTQIPAQARTNGGVTTPANTTVTPHYRSFESSSNSKSSNHAAGSTSRTPTPRAPKSRKPPKDENNSNPR